MFLYIRKSIYIPTCEVSIVFITICMKVYNFSIIGN